VAKSSRPRILPRYVPAEQLVMFARRGSRPEQSQREAQRDEATLVRLAVPAWRLYRIRKRAKRLKELNDLYRGRILNRVPDWIYRFTADNGKHRVQVTIVRQQLKQIQGAENIQTFLRYLGPHAPKVVTSIKVPTMMLLAEPGKMIRLFSMLLRLLGSELVAQISLEIDRQQLDELVENGDLPAPDEFFSEGDGSVRVLVEPVESL
jgi:hypothetical protein